MTFDDFLARLAGVRRRGDQATARCPAHDDEHPSLSVRRGDDGRLLLRCHAGCATEAVLAALGLEARDLFADHETTAERTTRYTIRDTTGRIVAVHVRVDRPGAKKRITWERPDGTPGLGGLRVERLPLYGVHELPEDLTTPIVVTEGEKARDALKANGIAAVGTVTGASGTPGDDSLRPVLGRPVVIWPDADPPGRAHGERLGAALWRLGHRDVRTIHWLDAPAGGDAADFFLRGGTVEEVRALIARATPWAPGAPGPAGGAGARRPRLIPLSSVRPEPVEFLWSPYIPAGKLTLLEGDPAAGKSFLAIDLAARVTAARPFPTAGDDTPQRRHAPGTVIYVGIEDGVADTIRPRFDRAGGDPDRFIILQVGETVDPETGAVREIPFTLADLDLLEAAVLATRPCLVIVDPIQAYIGSNVDMHRANEVRPILAGLARLAERYRFAVVLVRHLTKSAADRAAYRGLGSIDFTAVARSILLAGRDPEDPSRRHLVHTKSSTAPEGRSMVYRITTEGRVAWEGASGMTAQDLLARDRDAEDREARAETRHAVEDAETFLREMLAHGAVPVETLQRAAREAGCAWRTIERAKARLRIRSRKAAFTGRWEWVLADEDRHGPIGAESLAVFEESVTNSSRNSDPSSKTANDRGLAVFDGAEATKTAKDRDVAVFDDPRDMPEEIGASRSKAAKTATGIEPGGLRDGVREVWRP